MSKEYWQIAAGTSDRDYTDRFLQFGMAFVGGDAQRAAMAQIAVGDIVLLKRGTKKIAAVGEVVERNGRHSGNGDKDWLYDVDGWDLPAYCYVDWRKPAADVDTEGLTQATIQKVPQTKHRELADSVLQLPIREFSPEPPTTKPISDDEILMFLVGEGLRPTVADELANAFRRIRLLADYYYNHCAWADIGEHESRSFLVIPLLLALGWSEQQLKIEFGCAGGIVDIACFPKPYKKKEDNEEGVVLIETKNFGAGLGFAHPQARDYAQHFPQCQVLVVTNGWCYKAFRRSALSEDFGDIPSAYLNILKPRHQYPLDPTVTGALGVLKWLLPHSVR